MQESYNDQFLYKELQEYYDVKLEKTIECNIATNLSLKNYNDDEIKKIYSSRWCIEVFFKFYQIFVLILLTPREQPRVFDFDEAIHAKLRDFEYSVQRRKLD